MMMPGRISIGVPGPPGRPVGPGPGLRRYMGSYKKGGSVSKTGLYKLHAGERVIPAERLKNAKRALIKKG